MEKNIKTSVFSNSLIWFGAGVSIAEIITGTLIAPLGFQKGLIAIILGHLIGCTLLFLAGLIGAKTEKSAMETVKISFGERGSILFSSLNVLQLVGWTAVMIISGAAAANSALALSDHWIWSLIIGALILVWIMIGIKNLGKINVVAMGGLFILTIIMCTVIFKGNISTVTTGGISFGSAVELSVAMPLSWLPLISDYTRNAKRKKAATIASASVYFCVSCWMYIIGMGAALFAGTNNIATIMVQAGLGVAGLIIIIFSTVTTTFLDAYSAGVSSVSISKKINEKWAAVIVCIVGTALAIFAPITQFQNFLYFISSVFAPMIAIQLVDFFLFKNDSSTQKYNLLNIGIWVIGFLLYRISLNIDTPVGHTLPIMLATALLAVIANKIFKRKKSV